MHEHHGTLILLILLKQRDDVPLTVGAESTRRLFQNWLSLNLQLRYVYRHCTLYIATAICIQHCTLYMQLQYVYRHCTLYIATAICISALHFIYCKCDMYICNALYILQLRYVYRHCTLYIGNATAISISAPQLQYTTDTVR